MSRFRKQDRDAAQDDATLVPKIFLIEDSVALGLLLKHRIEAETSVQVEWHKTYAEAAAALAAHRPSLAISGFNLPDAPSGEMLDLLTDQGVPTIVFSAGLDRKLRDRISSPNVVDYFLKDAKDCVDQILHTIARTAANSAIPILVVDDMQSSRESLVELLRRQNFQIFEACSGKDALAILAANEAIELVVTDYHMPDMDGQQLLQQIRSLYAPDRLRVIGISASSDPFLSASFLKAGASDFVYRPYIAEEVKCRINSNIETLSQIKRLRFLAERDPMTALFNRRAFFERAGKITADLKKRDGIGSVAILDIDHFKKVNDTYGHDVGDTVIKAVATVLSDAAAEANAVAARFGGEEFVVLFSDLDSDAVQASCEAIRQRVAEMAIPYGNTTFGITASMGVAALQLGEGMDNNLNAADQMLYMAKANGRNRIFNDALIFAS
ncbi:MAG: diguanylate cyclase [Sphingobium sp.]|nr:diguanylate cyclase [Sphingobium sp.]